MNVIALFNHKGGVSKTTTTFNLGWMLAESGYKTLIVDADPQCNLTALVVGYNYIDDFDSFFDQNKNCDIWSCIAPIINGQSMSFEIARPYVTKNKNLSILCGSIELSELETQMSVALAASTAIPAIKNIPGSIGTFIRNTAQQNDFDYVLIDMSPSVGALNQCLLMSSDYFIVPTAPDFFCAQAIKSLTKVIPRWNEEVSQFRKKTLNFRLPDAPPKFIGFLSQKYRPRNSMPAQSFQKWIDIIQKEVSDSFVPELEKINMSISKDEFNKFISSKELFNIANISDFNSLIAQSQKNSVPVFALTDEQIDQSGTVLQSMTTSRDSFKLVFKEMAFKIDRLLKNLNAV